DLPSPTDAKADASVDPDRLYLDVALENRGGAPREVSRATFQLRSPDGKAWPPLAGNFAPLLIEPGERLTTPLIRELPRWAARLALVWTEGGAEARFRIPDDNVGWTFAALCRSLATAWREWSGPAGNAGKPDRVGGKPSR